MRQMLPAFLLALATITGCGNDPPTVIVNPGTGISCTTDADCPYDNMKCDEQNHCVTQPYPEGFWMNANSAYESVSYDGVIIMLLSNKDAEYTATIVETSKVVSTGHADANIHVPIRVTGLLPGTTYTILFTATSTEGEKGSTFSIG